MEKKYWKKGKNGPAPPGRRKTNYRMVAGQGTEGHKATARHALLSAENMFLHRVALTI